MIGRLAALGCLAACSSGAAPPALPPSTPPSSTPAPSAPMPRARPSARDANVELVARCATEAVELLGWNPLPDGAHRGMALRTAQEHGGSPECASLATDANVWSFEVGGDVIDWNWDPKDRGDVTAIRFAFTCKGCKTVETTVELPRRWHCFGWIHRQHFGSGCYPSHAACEAGRAKFPTTMPCKLRTGAAWCQRSNMTVCFESPWACARQAGLCDRDPPL